MTRIVALLLALLCGPLSAQWASFQANGGGGSTFTSSWQSVKICCGGLLNSIHISPSDGTMVVTANTMGAYLYKSTGTCAPASAGGWGSGYAAPCWEQLVTTNSIQPVSLAMVNALNYGVLEAVSCNNNTNDAYMLFNGNLWVTTNLQATAASRRWTQTTLTTSINANQGIGTGTGRAIACDPNNPNVVYTGTPVATYRASNGLSGASASFSSISGVGTTGAVPSVIAIDPASTTGTCSALSGSPTCSLHFWIFTSGTGVYETYNGGTSFTLTSGGPTAATTPGGTIYGLHMVADGYSQLWVVNGTTTVYKYTPNGSAGGGTWTTGTATGNGVYLIAVDPTTCCSTKTTNRVIVEYQDGSTQISNNNGSTFNAQTFNISTASSAPQPIWVGTAWQGDNSMAQKFLDTQDMVFDNSGNLFVAAGIGVWEATPTIGTNPVSYVANTVGIEELVTNQVWSPPGIGPIISFWDRAFFGQLNPDAFPSNYYTGSATQAGNGVQAGWGLDYAAGTTGFLTGYVGTSGNFSASTTNGGKTWTLWSNFASPNNVGGAIATSSPTNWVYTPGEPNAIYYTTNGASSAWLTPTFSGGTPANWFNADGLRIPFAADRTTTGRFCIVDLSQQFFTSTNSGANFAKVNVSSVDGTPYNDQLKAVPGNAGHYWYSAGNAGGGVTTAHLWKSTDACVHWTDINVGMTNVYSFGFGVAKPGGAGYPVIYAFATISAVSGIYESDDAGTTWALANVPSSAQNWPNNAVDFVKDISGDMNVYGRIYVGYAGSGATYIDKADACPWVNFSNTSPNDALTGTVTLNAQASGLVPVTNVSFYVDGTLIGTQTTGSGTPKTYSQSWVTGGVATGAHTLKVQATGNGCTSSGNSFSIPVTTSFLMVRDLNPANDNTPMWLNAAA